jgi:hypothetical protein
VAVPAGGAGEGKSCFLRDTCLQVSVNENSSLMTQAKKYYRYAWSMRYHCTRLYPVQGHLDEMTPEKISSSDALHNWPLENILPNQVL